MDTTDGPLPGLDSFSRIGGLAVYDNETRQAIVALKDKIDVKAATELWKMALESTWERSPVVVHGDISTGNLLVQEGKLSAVIDFGGLAVGDPACDLVIAWKFFQGKSKEPSANASFRCWYMGPRSRLALWKALITAAGFMVTNAVEAAQAWRTIDEVLADHKSER